MDATMFRRSPECDASGLLKCEAKRPVNENSLICVGHTAAYIFVVLIAERFFSAVPHGHLLGVRDQDIFLY